MVRQINDAGLDLIKSSEGCRLKAYLDGGGVPTIGYGSTKGIKMGDEITQSQAEVLLIRDLQHACVGVESVVDVDIFDNQYAALVCLTFNIGVAAFSQSTLLRLLNEGKYDEAKAQFIRWNRDNGKEIPGLTARREREAKLFGS